ncbi:MAG TPA: efflux RND transporter periplasmic adaptor subunit [Gammaproteobacteria bacterium]|nr:efflux RND transporter periplasmic adaptor subunit [Gammaproteobacteria bacterium]
MKRRTVLLLGGVVAAATAIAFYATRPQPIEVETAVVERGRVTETVTNTRAGTIKACERAQLAPAMAGQIARLPVAKGDRVERGQILLEIWNEDLRAQLEVAKRDAVATRARAEEVCVASRVARRESDRLSALLERGLVAEDAVDRADGDAESREAACRAATQNTKVAEARIDQAQANLERTLLRAPFAGIVAEINGELGEFVTPSPVGVPTLPAVDVVDTSCIYVTAPMDEVDAPRIREGMQARVVLDAFRGVDFPAHVRRVAPYVLDLEKQARTVEVEAEIDDKRGADLLPGYSADIEVVLDERADVLRVPTRAVMEGSRVYVFDPAADRVELREIETGLGNWDHTEIRSGLTAGELVVTTIDREGLADGAAAVSAGPTPRS